mmetsp:Transcript_14569/g.25153  ORF Transcript_14569/g.25153 Transcript_14569/m.25153 type:complete len:104 (+) Transcript_14569:101-412(+)
MKRNDPLFVMSVGPSLEPKAILSVMSPPSTLTISQGLLFAQTVASDSTKILTADDIRKECIPRPEMMDILNNVWGRITSEVESFHIVELMCSVFASSFFLGGP